MHFPYVGSTAQEEEEQLRHWSHCNSLQHGGDHPGRETKVQGKDFWLTKYLCFTNGIKSSLWALVVLDLQSYLTHPQHNLFWIYLISFHITFKWLSPPIEKCYLQHVLEVASGTFYIKGTKTSWKKSMYDAFNDVIVYFADFLTASLLCTV